MKYILIIFILLYSNVKFKIIDPRHVVPLDELMNLPSTIRHDFKIVNMGSSELVIESVKSSCSCTSVTYDQLISPLDTGLITLETTNEQLRNVKEVYAVLKTNADFKLAKVSIKVK